MQDSYYSTGNMVSHGFIRRAQAAVSLNSRALSLSLIVQNDALQISSLIASRRADVLVSRRREARSMPMARVDAKAAAHPVCDATDVPHVSQCVCVSSIINAV